MQTSTPSYPPMRLNYVELSVADAPRSRAFYESAFGWRFTDYAPTYAATATDDTDLGIDADRRGPPLPVVESSDVERSLALVEAAGGEIVQPITPFPGGRRFHFRDPDGNEIAVWQRD